MKFIVMLGDGMGDWSLQVLKHKTPLEAAHNPRMDYIAQHGAVGTARTVPDNMAPASDTANLCVLGYAPQVYYTGRSPLEAVSLGIALKPTDVVFRCNLVTLSGEKEYQDKTMVDFSAGEVSTDEAAILIDYLNENLSKSDLHFYHGISYRHCMIINDAKTGAVLTPPHDISSKPIAGHLPKGLNSERLLGLMERSHALLSEHPINVKRVASGKLPANSIWFWGEGTKPCLTPFTELYGIKGSVVCAVDLIKGLGICAGMNAPTVIGATGAKRTNFAAKGRVALSELRSGADLVYIHVEAPDESAHAGDVECKIEAIEAIDRDILGPIMDGLTADGTDFRILLLPDHLTPIEIRTHCSDPVPFVLYDSTREALPHAKRYTERDARQTGLHIEEGFTLMGKLVTGDF